jgi:hypothetical protein
MIKFYNNFRVYVLTASVMLCLAAGVQAQDLFNEDLNNVTFGDAPSNYMKIHDQFKKQQNPLWKQQNQNREIRDDLINQPDTVTIHGVSVFTQRQTHTYSETGNRAHTLVQKLDNNIWGLYKQETATFDDEDNKLTSIVENFVNGAWANYSKTIRTFTTNHNVLTEIKQYWVDAAWENDTKSTFVYNTAGNPVSLLIEVWNINEWGNSSFELYTYDDSGNMVMATGQLWVNGLWNNRVMYNYTYDANGNMLTGVAQNWVEENWLNVYKDIYAYNTANNPSNYGGQIWDTVTSTWVNDIQFSYDYNELDYLSFSEQREWIDGGWENFETGEYTYTTFGSLESTIMQLWDGNAYENTSLTQSDFDEYGNAVNVYFYNWSGSIWVLNEDGILPMSYNFNTKEERFIGSYLTAHYASLPVSISETASPDKAEIRCFPNPSNGETTIFFNFPVDTEATMSMYSLTGNKIKTIVKSPFKTGTHQISLSTNEYHPGLYFLLLETVQNKFTYKLIIN